MIKAETRVQRAKERENSTRNPLKTRPVSDHMPSALHTSYFLILTTLLGTYYYPYFTEEETESKEVKSFVKDYTANKRQK